MMITVDLKDILKLIFRIAITIIMIGLVIWGVYWFNHGGQHGSMMVRNGV